MNRKSLVKPENFRFHWQVWAHKWRLSAFLLLLWGWHPKRKATIGFSNSITNVGENPSLSRVTILHDPMLGLSAPVVYHNPEPRRKGLPRFLDIQRRVWTPSIIKNEESARQAANQTHNGSVREQKQGHHKISCTNEEWNNFVNQTHNIHTIMVQNSQTIPEATVKEDDNMMPSSGISARGMRNFLFNTQIYLIQRSIKIHDNHIRFEAQPKTNPYTTSMKPGARGIQQNMLISMKPCPRTVHPNSDWTETMYNETW